jgi:hypothetical protein
VQFFYRPLKNTKYKEEMQAPGICEQRFLISTRRHCKCTTRSNAAGAGNEMNRKATRPGNRTGAGGIRIGEKEARSEEEKPRRAQGWRRGHGIAGGRRTGRGNGQGARSPLGTVQRGNVGLGVQSAGAAEQQHYFRFGSAAPRAARLE